MASWVLVPAAISLRGEIDTIAPERDKSSDGSIGDQAHAERPSDHNPDETGATPDEDSDSVNEVHAIDVDKDLNRSDVTMQDVVDTIVARCRRDNSDPENEARLKYIIFNRYIWDAPDWKKEPYTGSNPHDKHAHFSFEYGSKYSQSTAPWGLVAQYGDDVTPEDIDKIAARVWGYLIADANAPADKPRSLSAATWLGWSDSRHVGTRNDIDQKIDAQTSQLLNAQAAGMNHIASSLGLVDQRIGQWFGKLLAEDDTDEAAIASAVSAQILATLPPAVIAGVIAGLPTDIAGEVVDEIRNRLSRMERV